MVHPWTYANVFYEQKCRRRPDRRVVITAEAAEAAAVPVLQRLCVIWPNKPADPVRPAQHLHTPIIRTQVTRRILLFHKLPAGRCFFSHGWITSSRKPFVSIFTLPVSCPKGFRSPVALGRIKVRPMFFGANSGERMYRFNASGDCLNTATDDLDSIDRRRIVEESQPKLRTGRRQRRKQFQRISRSDTRQIVQSERVVGQIGQQRPSHQWPCHFGRHQK